MPPDRALPFVVQVTEPVRRLDQRRTRAGDGVREASSVPGGAEPNLLSGRARWLTLGTHPFDDRADELVAAAVHGANEALPLAVVSDCPTRRFDPTGEGR